MKKIVVFTGAGISAESGISTFRDADGLWKKYRVEDVATPEAFKRNPKLVLDFYNLRRKQVIEAMPNSAHFFLSDLEKEFKVDVITQNVDDLHERAGSSSVLHLHGEITKSESINGGEKQYPIVGAELNIGDLCVDGNQLRPAIVWFGEAVPNMLVAEGICKKADVLIVIGTSLNVYPAASVLDLVPVDCVKYLIDPEDVTSGGIKNLTIIKEKASIGIPILAKFLKLNKII